VAVSRWRGYPGAPKGLWARRSGIKSPVRGAEDLEEPTPPTDATVREAGMAPTSRPRLRDSLSRNDDVKILIAEDDPTSALLLRKTLESDGYDVVATADGVQALATLRAQSFDAVLTDWMMPNMDGISLVRRVRAEFHEPPPILVITALSSADARQHALEAGADDYLAKPYQPKSILQRLRDCIERAHQPAPSPGTLHAVQAPAAPPSHVGVGIAASTGGPEALRTLLPSLDPTLNAAYLLVLHGPDWMLETFTERAAELTRVTVRLAADGDRVVPRTLYVCPGDRHMKVEASGPSIVLTNEPPENFVRPAADPLFRTLASVYGPRSVAVVLTGMGRDGSMGAQQVHAVGGQVLAQDPVTAIAASMPRTTIGLGLVDRIAPIDQIGAMLAKSARIADRGVQPTGA